MYYIISITYLYNSRMFKGGHFILHVFRMTVLRTALLPLLSGRSMVLSVSVLTRRPDPLLYRGKSSFCPSVRRPKPDKRRNKKTSCPPNRSAFPRTSESSSYKLESRFSSHYRKFLPQAHPDMQMHPDTPIQLSSPAKVQKFFVLHYFLGPKFVLLFIF